MKLSDFDKVKELVEQRQIYDQILRMIDGGIIASPSSEVDGIFVLHIGHEEALSGFAGKVNEIFRPAFKQVIASIDKELAEFGIDFND